jgi:23S rRNA (guanine745-N1)-methyltransferase
MPLSRTGDVLRCGARHTFDIARRGYVSLLPGDAPPGRADTAAMVAARDTFLAAGHYRPIARAVATECRQLFAGHTGGCVVDIGAGTGYFLGQVLDRLTDRVGLAVGLAVDLSTYAVRRAARAHPRIGAVQADAWGRLPIRTQAAVAVLNVFAPRDGAEIRRILLPSGGAVIVTPTRRHLIELVQSLELLSVDERKGMRLDAKLNPHLALRHRHIHESPMLLARPDIAALVAMGPSSWHVDPVTTLERIEALPEPMAVTESVTISVYTPR